MVEFDVNVKRTRLDTINVDIPRMAITVTVDDDEISKVQLSTQDPSRGWRSVTFDSIEWVETAIAGLQLAVARARQELASREAPNDT